MKRLLISFLALSLLGAGCIGRGGSEPTTQAPTTFEHAYTNEMYGFEFEYPEGDEVNLRPEKNQDYNYMGIDVKYFGTLRDLVREPDKPTNIAALYAVDDLSVEEFKTAVEATSESVSIKEEKQEEYGGLKMTKLINTTEAGIDKTHYLFESEGQTIIVSVFLYESENFEPILKTFREI